MAQYNGNLSVDAALSHEESNFVAFSTHNARLIGEIHMEDLTLLEADLDDCEKVSLIFLLYGSDPKLANTGLQHILLHLSKPAKNSSYLYQWARHRELQGQEWKEMLVEALCIAQAYHVVEKLGLYKQQLEEVYLPYRADTALVVNKLVKALYLLAESWKLAQAKKLVSFVEQKTGTKMAFNEPSYLEAYFLHWQQQNVIKFYPGPVCQVDVILEFLANEGLKNIKNNFEILLIDLKEKKDEVNISKPNKSAQEAQVTEDLTVYKVTRNYCGFVLVINQKHFERDPRVKGLKEYNARAGTEHDSSRLKATFESRGYKVIMKENLNHAEIIEEVKRIVEASVCYESLIVCVLSHGEDGVIISSNCIPIPIREIQKIMASEKLIYKPKMLIIQACQGGAPQTLVKTTSVEIMQVESDGVAESVSSPHADLLTALSTISGYASFRDRVKGTWYIQELCQVIDEYGDKNHMLDLLIMVNDKVSQRSAHKDGKIVGQLPEAKITLRRKFYLPKRCVALT